MLIQSPVLLFQQYSICHMGQNMAKDIGTLHKAMQEVHSLPGRSDWRNFDRASVGLQTYLFQAAPPTRCKPHDRQECCLTCFGCMLGEHDQTSLVICCLG